LETCDKEFGASCSLSLSNQQLFLELITYIVKYPYLNIITIALIALTGLSACSEDIVDFFSFSEPIVCDVEGIGHSYSRCVHSEPLVDEKSGDTIYAHFYENNELSSRAAPITIADSIKDTIAVWAYYNSPDKQNDGWLINNAMLFRDKDEGWTMDNVYYWPQKGSVNFTAYTPRNALTYDSINNTLSYTVPDKVEDQKDVLLATTDALSGGKVGLTFNHLCAQLSFILDSDLPKGVIEEISLSGLKYKGTYDIKKGTWSLKDDTKTFALDTLGQETLHADTVINKLDDVKTLMLLPQDLTNVELNLTISYYTQNKTSSTITYTITTGQQWKTTIGTSKLEQGKSYTIKISSSNSTIDSTTGTTSTTTITPSTSTDANDSTAVYQEFDSFYFIKKYIFTLKPTTKKWKIVANDATWLTFTKTMGKYHKYGFWVDSEKGNAYVEGTAEDAVNNKITVYAYCTENISSSQRDATVELIEDGIYTDCEYMRQQAPYQPLGKSFYTARYGYPTPCVWGFNTTWGTMVFTCVNEHSVYDQISADGTYITKDETNKTITLNFGALEGVVSTKNDDGLLSNKNLFYHTDNSSSGGSDGKGLMKMLQTAFALMDKCDSYTGDIDTFLGCAAVRAAQYNKFTLISLYGVDVPNLESGNMVWYLPGINEITTDLLTSSSTYWTATGYKSNDICYAYTYTPPSTSTSNYDKRENSHLIRAVRTK
jgi:hypothetical protein